MTATDRRRFLTVAALLAALAPPAAARAQDAARDPIAAEALFERGKALVEQGKIDEACRAFEGSERLDPAGGTMLRLALCHEQLGKLASAAFEFHEVVRMSKEGSGDPAKLAERVRIANEELAKIEPRVPRLVVVVPAAARAPGLAVTANGLPRTEATWGVAIPTDPGDVVVEANAPARRGFRTTVHLGEKEERSVEIPPLAEEGSAASVPGPSPSPSPVPPDGREAASAQRPIAVAVGAAGLVAVGVGTFFGIRAIGKWHDADSACPGTSCDATSVGLADDAKTAARIADFTIGAGVLALAAGVVLWVTGAPKQVHTGVGSVAVTF